jgi:MFS superfamily sulfate permease-like transporter
LKGNMTSQRTGYPLAAWLRGYSPDWLRLDIVAGLTTAAVVIPKAMACAVIAGLPVQAGLYTAISRWPGAGP